MPSPALSSTQPSILTKDAYPHYPSPPASLIALALPLPGMLLPIISPASPINPTLMRDNVEPPESIVNIAEQAIRLSREALGLDTQTKAGTSEISNPHFSFPWNSFSSPRCPTLKCYSSPSHACLILVRKSKNHRQGFVADCHAWISKRSSKQVCPSSP